MIANVLDRHDVLIVDSGTGARRVRLDKYLDAAAQERAATDAYAWIKRLRELDVDGQPFRRRFTLRDDSLWWFAELYLHKQQVVDEVFRTLAAVDALIEGERPREIGVASGSRVLRGIAPQLARARKVRYRGRSGFGPVWLRVARLDLRARQLALAARASRLRLGHRPARGAPAFAAAFVHRAFWRRGAADGSAESYIGQVLQALEERMPGAVTSIGVGPAANFRARRWWHPLKPRDAGSSVAPIESFAPLAALGGFMRVWRERHAMRRALWQSAALRQHAVVGGCDCWAIIREELAGIALLQWPWSARAMDEAGAALDALRPGVVLTYAEAGGWGRAVVLECRRRGIPSVGLQHGFIYRHWLNYLHEPDEMAPDREHPEDAGFPRPALTLLFDDYARQHLQEHGRFPAESLAVTGSPRLDALAAAARSLTADDIARARHTAGAGGSSALVLLVAKYKEARHVLPPLMEAVASMPDVQLAVKAHPAETPDAYEAVAGGRPNIRVLPASVPLAPLLRASRAVVTMNSTVALDAAVLGVPALVIGLPNNLSPFVEAGIMAGATSPAEVAPALDRILYDEGFRRHLGGERSAYLARFGMESDGRAAARSADAVLKMAISDRSFPADRRQSKRKDQ
jgi:hypothetical protein